MLGGGLQPGVNQRPHRRRRRRRHSTVVETWKHLTSRHRAITKSPPSPPAAVPAPGGLQFSGGRTAEGPRLADAVGVGRSEHQCRRSSEPSSRSLVVGARSAADKDLQFPRTTNRLEMLHVPLLRVRLSLIHHFHVHYSATSGRGQVESGTRPHP